MTEGVGSAAGTSSVQGVAEGYRVEWVRLTTPYEAIGYEVTWVRITIPYEEVPQLVRVGGSGDNSKRRRVNDELDLYDLCEIWDLFLRKAA